jgi:hypothetical protein
VAVAAAIEERAGIVEAGEQEVWGGTGAGVIIECVRVLVVVIF